MATIYSLVCWGGSAGKSVSVSSTTDLVTLTNHGLRNSAGVQFTSGTLPTVSGTALALNTTYYAKSISISTFELYYDPALTSRIDFTSNGSSLILKGAYYRTISDYTRWGGSTGRIYDGILSALTSRLNAPALPGDDEVFEIAEAFDEIKNYGVSTASFPSNSLTITSRLNGARTTAYHHGVVGSGYRYISTAADTVLNINSYYVDVDGLEFCTDTTTNGTYYHILSTGSAGFFATIRNNIVNCLNTGEIHGIGINNTSVVYNNIVINIKGSTCGGFNVVGGGGCVVYNNLATKCSVGFLAQQNTQGLFYNNLSVGNTVNWDGSPTFPPVRADGNIGTLSETTTFTVTSGTRTMTTSVNVPFKSYSRCFFTTTGTLPTVGGVALRTDRVYYAVPVTGNNINISTAYNGGTVTFDGVGTGTHTIHWVWATSQCPTNYIDFSDPTLVFADWTNNDFRPAGTGSTPASQAKMVDTAVTVMGAVTATDIADKERPNYNNGGAEYKDVGPFEYDRGYGPRPSSDARGLAFTGLVAGSKVKVFTSGTDTEKFSSASSGTSETWSESVSGSLTVDYVIMKAGYLPIRVTGITVTNGPSGVQSVPVSQVVARWYQTSSGLTINTNCFADASTKKFGLTTTSTLQNLASYLLEQWVALGDTGEAYANKAFPIEANGPNSFTWLDGWEADLATYASTITNLSRDGMRYLSTSGVMTASWCALLSAGVPSDLQVRYQQVEGSAPTNTSSTGNIDQLIQIYGDSTHGNFDYRGYMVAKVQEQGYDQAEVDVVAQYGNLEDQLYVIALLPLPNGVAAANPTVSSVTIIDHGASPVTWNSKAFSITITDSGATSGETIMQWIRRAMDVGGTFQGKDAFNWHDLIQVNGDKFKGVRGAIYGDTGASLKGVRVLRGTDAHPDFTIHTADDGSTVSTTPPAQATATILANSRVQLYNVTTATELDNVFVTGTTYSNTLSSGVSVGDTVRLRVCKLGYEGEEVIGVWTASGVQFIISQNLSPEYAAWGIDGSTVTEYSLDGPNIQIDANDVDGASTKTRLGAFYNYALTTEVGIRQFYGAITFISTAAIRVNTSVANLYIENTNATTALRFTDLDVRLYKDDGTSIIATTSYSIHNDYSGVPDVVETGVSGLTAAESNQLFAIPTTGGGATVDEIWSDPKALSVPKFLGLK